jgi:hypothetical protein
VIKSNSDNVPDFGLGKGVLSTKEISFVDEFNQGFDNNRFLVCKMRLEDDILREIVKVRWTEKNKKVKVKK